MPTRNPFRSGNRTTVTPRYAPSWLKALVSFDNDEIASYLRPGLTTIGLPHEEMGALAVQLLLGATKKGENLVEMPVIIRASIKQV